MNSKEQAAAYAIRMEDNSVTKINAKAYALAALTAAAEVAEPVTTRQLTEQQTKDHLQRLDAAAAEVEVPIPFGHPAYIATIERCAQVVENFTSHTNWMSVGAYNKVIAAAIRKLAEEK